MRILFGLYYGRSIYYASKRWKGTIICSTLHEPCSVWVHGLRFLRYVAHQSCAFWVFNIYMFGPHAKRWWLSSRTHLSGYQRYRCFPSVGPLGPSLLFAYIYMSTHTCMCTHESLPSSWSGYYNDTSWTDLALCGELVYDFWHTRHINVVYSNMHARITSIHMHVVVAFERYTPSCGYRRQAYIYSWARVDIHDHLDQQQDRLPWRILHLVRVIVV